MRLQAAGYRQRVFARPGRSGTKVTPGLRAASLGAVSLTLLAAGCGVIGIGAGGPGRAISVAAVPGIDNASLYLAKHEGLFQKAGLSVTIVKYSSDARVLAAIHSGTAQIAADDYADIFVNQANTRGHPYRIISDGYDAAAGVIEILTMPNSRVSTPADLTGETVAAPNTDLVNAPAKAPRSLAVAAAISVLQSYGVNQTTINWSFMTPRAEVTALIQGKVQAILATEPAIFLAQEHGAVELIDACSGPTAAIPLAGYFTTLSWASGHASEITAFRNAISRAAEVAAMPGPIQSVLPRYAGLTRQQAALVTVGTYPLSTIPASLQRTIDLMDTEGMIRYRIFATSTIASG